MAEQYARADHLQRAAWLLTGRRKRLAASAKSESLIAALS
jgi:hypothetical protein